MTAHEGIYLKNLERPVRVTHLLCSGDTETDKMKYAEKFNKRKEAHIHLVWEEWFWDCLEFGGAYYFWLRNMTAADTLLKGRFDERKYQVSRPRPERKSLHESEWLLTYKSLANSCRYPDPVSPLPVQDSAPGSHRDSAIPVGDVNPLRRSKHAIPAGSFTVINNLSLDGEEEEMAVINKPVPAVTLQLWKKLLEPRGFEFEGGKLVRSPSKSKVRRSPPWTPTQPQPRLDLDRNRTGVEHGKEMDKDSIISSFRRVNSFAPVPVKGPTIRQPFRRNTTFPSVCLGEGRGGLRDPAQPEERSAVPTLFAGHTFRLLGEARCPNVRFAVENGGGLVTDDDTEEASFIIVRLIRYVSVLSDQVSILSRGSGSKLFRDEFDDHARSKYRTECWLEHSVFHERICEPNENVSFTPLTIATPVPGTFDSTALHVPTNLTI